MTGDWTSKRATVDETGTRARPVIASARGTCLAKGEQALGDETVGLVLEQVAKVTPPICKLSRENEVGIHNRMPFNASDGGSVWTRNRGAGK